MVTGMLVCMLLTACKKDGIDPPSGEGSTMDMLFAFHCGDKPFRPDSIYRDGFGAAVQFTQLRFALHGTHLLGDQGQDMGDWPATLLVADLAEPSRMVSVTKPKSGDVHWMDSRTTLDDDARVPALEDLVITDGDYSFLAVLDVQGIVDSNDNGSIDTADAHFRIAIAPDAADAALRIHAHAVVFPDRSAVLEVPVDVARLLKDIDLTDQPVTMGHGANATQALANLRTCVLGAN